jgi:catechol-2,3-dioxygenase
MAASRHRVPESDRVDAHAGTKVRDPEGNVFEIYWDPDGPQLGAV